MKRFHVHAHVEDLQRRPLEPVPALPLQSLATPAIERKIKSIGKL